MLRSSSQLGRMRPSDPANLVVNQKHWQRFSRVKALLCMLGSSLQNDASIYRRSPL
jgi:hypothetical protein